MRYYRKAIQRAPVFDGLSILETADVENGDLESLDFRRAQKAAVVGAARS